MVLVTSNKGKRLIYACYIGVVTPEELERSREDIEAALSEMPVNIRWLGDLSALEKMEAGCEVVIGQIMERLDAHGVEVVLRVIPDASKDIGLNILTIFHYSKRPRVVTCENLVEAARALEL